MVKPEDLCRTCSGKKVSSERKILEINVEKGMKKGDHVRFTGEGDQIPGVKLSGDVLIIVDQKPTRAGIDPYNKLIDRNGDDNTMDVSSP